MMCDERITASIRLRRSGRRPLSRIPCCRNRLSICSRYFTGAELWISRCTIGLAFCATGAGLRTLTARTCAADRDAAARTGTGVTIAPSTRVRWSITTAGRIPGIAEDALTASAALPSRMTTSSPVSRSQHATAKGTGRSSIRPGPIVSVIRSRNAPPPTDRTMIHPRRDQSTAVKKASISAALIPRAKSAPTIEPIEVPAIAATSIPSSSSPRSTPTWARPLAAPPPRARETSDPIISEV